MKKQIDSPNGPPESPKGRPHLDLDRLRARKQPGGVTFKKTQAEIPLEKPRKGIFFRTHLSWRDEAEVLDAPGPRGNTFYLLYQDVDHGVSHLVSRRLLVPTITRDGAVAIWPARLPNGKSDTAATSALTAIAAAEKQWMSIAYQSSQRAYEMKPAAGISHEPEWPFASWEELLDRAAQNALIASPDHPVLRRLRGEI
jgi:hypothetical protein